MATKNLTAKLVRKANNKKGFKIEGSEEWYNASEAVVPYLEKISEGTSVTISYFKKGVTNIVTKIVKEESGSASETTKPKENAPRCSVCGKELKNPNYPTCWDCRDKQPKSKQTTEQKPKTEPPQKTYSKRDDSTQAAIQRGNALNAAAAAVSGNFAGSDPATIAQAVKLIAIDLLDWLKAE